MRALEVELTLAEIASGQWGLFTAQQAREAGVDRVRLSRLAKAGVLIRLTHGVYGQLGASQTEHLELRAAWLGAEPGRTAGERVGDGAAGLVVSHGSAAGLYDFGDLDTDFLEFTAHVRKQTKRHDVRLHRKPLSESDVTIVDGLPVTTVERMIADLLADGRDGEHVAGVLAAAVRAHKVDLGLLGELVGPYAGRLGCSPGNGTAAVQQLLDLGGVKGQVLIEEVAATAYGRGSNIGPLLDVWNGQAKLFSDAWNPGLELQAQYLKTIADIVNKNNAFARTIGAINESLANGFVSPPVTIAFQEYVLKNNENISAMIAKLSQPSDAAVKLLANLSQLTDLTKVVSPQISGPVARALTAGEGADNGKR